MERKERKEREKKRRERERKKRKPRIHSKNRKLPKEIGVLHLNYPPQDQLPSIYIYIYIYEEKELGKGEGFLNFLNF